MKKKKLRSMLITIGVIAVLLLALYLIGRMVINNLIAAGVVSQADIQSTIQMGGRDLIPIAVVLGIIIILLIVCWNRSYKFLFWLKWESLIVFFVTVVTCLAMMVFGPLQGLMNANNAGSSVDRISAKTVNTSNDLARNITAEGSILLKNQHSYLPIKGQNINVFGWASTNPLYGGSGSGAVNAGKTIDIYSSLNAAGFKTNNQLRSFYTKYRKNRPQQGIFTHDWTLPEPKQSQYSAQLINHAKNFSNTAMIVIARPGGEGADEPTNMSKLLPGNTYKNEKSDWDKNDTYLQLDKPEKALLKMVNKNFKNIIVVINSANPMELGWLNQYSHIKSALWMAGTGNQGFDALGKILNGQIDPSGRTADTYVYNLKKTPTFNNFGNFAYKNGLAAYVHNVENIYVGYKFWETRYLHNNTGYRRAVQFPFGYGLSYTKFSQRMSNLKTNSNGDISFSVTVKNTGKRAGKDVVQTYFTAPYTNGGLEKSATNLLDFAKTNNLKPGQSQTITFKANRYQMASYDSKNGGAYVLDPGRYQIQIKNNSHDVIASRNYRINKRIVYNSLNKRPGDVNVAKDQFQYAQNDGSNFTYLSRKNNFANYKQATKAPTQNVDLKKSLLDSSSIPQNNSKEPKATGKMPAQSQHNNMLLVDMRGKSYSDPRWNKLISQMSVRDMQRLIAFGGYQTMPIRSIGKVGTHDFDGPAGFSTLFNIPNLNSTVFPSGVMIASTWNKNLARQVGEKIGQQGKQANIFGWYGPSMNIHRSAFGGRDFEYFSEDPELASVMAANEIAGARKYGVYAYMKHFAMNSQETNRMFYQAAKNTVVQQGTASSNMSGTMVWDTEQAIREIYLRPFEASVKTGGVRAVMTAYTFIGNRWSGANKALIQKVLRHEWGFHGLVETDYYAGGFLNGNQSIMNGGDAMLSTNGSQGALVKWTNNPSVVRQMRRASKDILYTVVNSGAYSPARYHRGQSVLWNYQRTYIHYIIIAGVILILLQLLAIYLYIRKYGKHGKLASTKQN